jgi:flagellar assembly protein FliH
LSSDEPRGKVFRNVNVSEEPFLVRSPGDLHSAQGFSEADLEGGRQIDPFLMAGAKIQDLHRTIETLLEKERRQRKEIEDLRKKLEETGQRVEEEEIRLRGIMVEEAEKARIEAAEKGMEEGYRDGLASSREEIREEIREEFRGRFGEAEALLGSIIGSLNTESGRLVDLNAPLMVKLWQAMLERLLRREVQFDSDTTLRVFRELIPRVSDRTRIRILLNPEDREMFLDRGKEFSEIKRAAESFELVADEYIEKGSCLIETNMGVYDASWKCQLEAVNREIDRLLQEA